MLSNFARRLNNHKKLNSWIITAFKYNNKAIAIINIYRLPMSLLKGLRCCLIQYNLKDSEVKSNNNYRKEILQQIIECINNNNIDNIIMGGDYN